jgi:hypothetical protein
MSCLSQFEVVWQTLVAKSYYITIFLSQMTCDLLDFVITTNMAFDYVKPDKNSHISLKSYHLEHFSDESVFP